MTFIKLEAIPVAKFLMKLTIWGITSGAIELVGAFRIALTLSFAFLIIPSA